MQGRSRQHLASFRKARNKKHVFQGKKRAAPAEFKLGVIKDIDNPRTSEFCYFKQRRVDFLPDTKEGPKDNDENMSQAPVSPALEQLSFESPQCTKSEQSFSEAEKSDVLDCRSYQNAFAPIKKRLQKLALKNSVSVKSSAFLDRLEVVAFRSKASPEKPVPDQLKFVDRHSMFDPHWPHKESDSIELEKLLFKRRGSSLRNLREPSRMQQPSCDFDFDFQMHVPSGFEQQEGQLEDGSFLDHSWSNVSEESPVTGPSAQFGEDRDLEEWHYPGTSVSDSRDDELWLLEAEHCTGRPEQVWARSMCKGLSPDEFDELLPLELEAEQCHHRRKPPSPEFDLACRGLSPEFFHTDDDLSPGTGPSSPLVCDVRTDWESDYELRPFECSNDLVCSPSRFQEKFAYSREFSPGFLQERTPSF